MIRPLGGEEDETSKAQVAPNRLSMKAAQANHSAEDCLAQHCLITRDNRVEGHSCH